MTDSGATIVLDPMGTDVHEEGDRLRAQGPIAQVTLPGNIRAWSVNGFNMVRQVLSDSRFSKDADQHWPAYISGEIGEDFPLIGWVMMKNVTTSEGDDHKRLRRLVASKFTYRRVHDMRPQVEAIVDDLLNRLEALPVGEVVDLKATFAYPLPVRVICDLFGVPDDMRADVLRGGEVNVDTTLTHEEAMDNVEQWHQAMYDLIALRRREPGDDLLSALIRAQEEDDAALDDHEMAGTLHLMLGAGSETTTNLISQAVVGLCSDGGKTVDGIREGEVGWREVVEETLRVDSPIAQMPFRFTTEEVTLGGVTIPKGDPVLIGFAASGRDPSRHAQCPADFDPRREDKEHLAFGHGIHHCLGAPLGRMEALIALEQLWARFPDTCLVSPRAELPPQGTFLLNGYAQLPVYLHGKPDPS